MDGEIKSFQDRQKLEEYVTTKPTLQEILRGILWMKRHPESHMDEKETENL